jgi:hypothetical protein
VVESLTTFAVKFVSIELLRQTLIWGIGLDQKAIERH